MGQTSLRAHKALFLRGLASERPDEDNLVGGTFFYATDTEELTYTVGTGWLSVGGGADLSAIAESPTPATTDTYDLGTALKGWRDLYMAEGAALSWRNAADDGNVAWLKGYKQDIGGDDYDLFAIGGATAKPIIHDPDYNGITAFLGGGEIVMSLESDYSDPDAVYSGDGSGGISSHLAVQGLDWFKADGTRAMRVRMTNDGEAFILWALPVTNPGANRLYVATGAELATEIGAGSKHVLVGHA